MFTIDGYKKDYIDKVASFESPAKIFGPSAEPEGEETYFSRLLDPDASFDANDE